MKSPLRVIAYADTDSKMNAADQAHILAVNKANDLLRCLEEFGSLRSLNPALWGDSAIDKAVDAVTAALFDLNAAVHVSWKKVVK